MLKNIKAFKKTLEYFAILIAVFSIISIINFTNGQRIAGMRNKKAEVDSSVELSLKDAGEFHNKVEGVEKIKLPSEGFQGYNIRLFNGDKSVNKERKIIYNSQPSNWYVSIGNINSYNDKVNLMLFVDGAIQPFYVDDSPNLQQNYICDLPAYSQINIPIKIDFNKSGVNAPKKLWIVSTVNLDKKPSSDYDHITYFTNTMEVAIESSDETSDKKFIDDNTGKIVPRKSNIGQAGVFRLAIDLDESIKDIQQKTKISVKKGQKTNFKLEAIAPTDEKYVTYMFLNHEPIVFYNNKNYMKWSVKENQMLSEDFMLDVPKETGEYQIYTLSIPVSDKEDFIYESEKFILEVTD